MKICASGRREEETLRFVTSHSRFSLASLRNHAKNGAPEEKTGQLLYDRSEAEYDMKNYIEKGVISHVLDLHNSSYHSYQVSFIQNSMMINFYLFKI